MSRATRTHATAPDDAETLTGHGPHVAIQSDAQKVDRPAGRARASTTRRIAIRSASRGVIRPSTIRTVNSGAAQDRSGSR